MLKLGSKVAGKIKKMAFGGSGILKEDQFVLFVPFSAIGDTISCQITELKKSYGKAKLLEILDKSLLREKPKCRYFEQCGGCQLQHLQYKAELEQKRVWIQEALEKIGGFKGVAVGDVHPSPQEYHYRRHITLTLEKRGKEKAFAGYHAFDSKDLIKIEECPIFIEKENLLLKEIQSFVEELELKENDAKLDVIKKDLKYLLHFHFKIFPKNAEIIAKKFLENNPNIKGIILGSPKKNVSFGTTGSSLIMNGLNFHFSSSAFMQNNREQSLKIYLHLLELVKQKNPGDILDLYCGIGISSLLMAKEGVKVTGVEYSRSCIKAAIQNAKENKITSAEFIHAKAEDALEKLNIPEFVIANPPREGLDIKVIEALKEKLPQTIVYISCMPTTLARDLKLLSEFYEIESCTPYDMFPKTTHVETLVLLKRL